MPREPTDATSRPTQRVLGPARGLHALREITGGSVLEVKRTGSNREHTRPGYQELNRRNRTSFSIST